MHRLLTLSILFFHLASGISYSQSQVYEDSLLNVVLTAKEDSNKVVTYLLYGGLFETSNPDSAQYYYDKSWDLGTSLNYRRGLGMNISYRIVLLNNKGKFREALALCEQAVRIYRELNSPRDLAIAYNNVGNEQQYLGELRSAIKHYLDAVAIVENLKDSTLVQLFTNNVSSVFVTLKEYEKGRRYADESYNIAKNIKDTFGMAATLVNLATCEAAVGSYKIAMKHLESVFDFSEYLDDYTLALDGYTNTGTIYNSLGEYDRALQQFQTAKDIAEHHQNPGYELVIWQGLTDTYLAQKNFRRADDAVMRAIRLADETGSMNELNDLYAKAAIVKENLGDLQAALMFHKKFRTLNDTLLNEKIRQNISELEVQYQTAKKDQSIAEQNLALEKNKASLQRKNVLLAWSLGGVFLLVLVTLASYWVYWQRQKLNREKIIALKKEQEVVRLKAILEGQDEERQRISKEMHDDVGSGLTSILYMTQNLLNGTPSETSTIAPKISRTANAMVEKMNEIIWSLNKQFDTTEDLVVYIRHSISELLEDRNIEYEFDVPDEIPQTTLTGEQRRNIYLVVKESVHNAIKHSQASLITITFDFRHEFSVVIHDDGKGIDLNRVRQFGNGLSNMKQRMELIGGKLEITNCEGTAVRASLPLSV